MAMIASRRASTCLVVLAHPDDEIFHGGMLSHLGGASVGVDHFSDSEPSISPRSRSAGLLDSGGESLAGNMLHGDERKSVGLADVVQNGDLRWLALP